jgi:hypothetical protein
MPATSISRTADQATEAHEPHLEANGPLSTVATMSAFEQQRVLWQHSDLVADHMANHFSRRSPHLAAKYSANKTPRSDALAVLKRVSDTPVRAATRPASRRLLWPSGRVSVGGDRIGGTI